MSVLITGATGLVGERLLPRLVDTGYACRALLRSGKSCPEEIDAVTGDILDPSSLANAVQGVSAIVHLAAVFRTQDTDLIWKSNLDGTRNLIAAVKTHAPDARFIMSSTSHVYNKNNPHPGKEDDPVGPQHAYPASKVAAEKELRESGLNWSILRFPFVYGDGDGHLQSLPKHASTWHPAQRMSTIHHRDIAQAVAMALEGVFDRRIVNLADEAPSSIYELAGIVGSRLDSSSEPLACPWYLHVDTSLARSLGFRPSIRTVYQAWQEDIS
jgi:nucleoside-diphosphate-sugar epimerase